MGNNRAFLRNKKTLLGNNRAFLRNKKTLLRNNRAFLRNKKTLLGNKRALLENKKQFWEIPPSEMVIFGCCKLEYNFKNFSTGTFFPCVRYPDP